MATAKFKSQKKAPWPYYNRLLLAAGLCVLCVWVSVSCVPVCLVFV